MDLSAVDSGWCAMSRAIGCVSCGGPKAPGQGRKFCGPCVEANKINRRTRPYTPLTKQGNRRHSLMKRYGLTLDQYEAMVVAQAGRCALCDRAPKPGRCLAVDHDHNSGRVRGLLCQACNSMLGVFERSPERVLTYLKCPDSILAPS